MSVSTPHNIAELTKRVKGGDRSAFSELYDNYSPALFGVVSKILKEDGDAEDVLQDAFVKIWKKINTFDESKGTIFTWMLNIARNTAIDKYRKLKREGKVDIQTLDYSVDEVENGSSKMSTETIGLKELVDKLSPEYQLMIEYIYFKGYTQQEVADELEMPLGTVKTRVRKAVSQLREIFITILVLLWT